MWFPRFMFLIIKFPIQNKSYQTIIIATNNAGGTKNVLNCNQTTNDYYYFLYSTDVARGISHLSLKDKEQILKIQVIKQPFHHRCCAVPSGSISIRLHILSIYYNMKRRNKTIEICLICPWSTILNFLYE